MPTSRGRGPASGRDRRSRGRRNSSTVRLAVVDRPVERREQRRSARERLAQQRRVDAPCALDALDHCRRRGRRDRPATPGPAAGRGLTSRGRDLAPRDHELEQLRDITVVGPPGRRPGHLAAVWEVAGRQWAGGGKPVEDVQAARLVGRHPIAPVLLSVAQLSGAWPLRHLRASRLVGRWRSRSCARTAMRQASTRESSMHGHGPRLGDGADSGERNTVRRRR